MNPAACKCTRKRTSEIKSQTEQTDTDIERKGQTDRSIDRKERLRDTFKKHTHIFVFEWFEKDTYAPAKKR
mgnify:CR=1 FL=1